MLQIRPVSYLFFVFRKEIVLVCTYLDFIADGAGRAATIGLVTPERKFDDALTKEQRISGISKPVDLQYPKV
ncbi:hypothetical protein EVC45_08580 [Paraburkholderia sp. UYCP14C]|uniref:hypothetical protein n=1 Tax=Paraburkholderia sp. UYCP14C TaxID=2511130 RepID=UPI00102126F6|nr:hypothetical protein [Paraburkholderia sp. UYCP14C]RZF30062.1 hypothetical protein EVC45_08580 [Paraburkholderia sp. UYCP14C]